MAADTTELLTESDLAKLTGLKPQTLQNWRSTHRGPAYVKLGRVVRYERAAIQEWIDESRRNAPRKQSN